MNSLSAAGSSGASAPTRASGPESALLAVARNMLAPAALLLGHYRAPFLTVAARHCGGTTRTRIVLWTDAFEIGQALTRKQLVKPGHKEAAETLRASGAPLYTHLSQRWPPNAVPPTIGVITEGAGMAVFSGHPSALSPACLLDHAARLSPGSVLIPFRANGPWALVAAAIGAQQPH